MDSWIEEEIIASKKLNSLSIRRGTTAEIEALLDIDVSIGDGFYDTTRKAWVIISKIDGPTRYYSVFSNILYHSDVLTGYNTGSHEVVRTLKFNSSDEAGLSTFVILVVNYESYDGVAGEIRLTANGNATSINDVIAVPDDVGNIKEGLIILDVTSVKDTDGVELLIELDDAKLHIIEVLST